MNVVLVPGAWHGAWSWHAVGQRVRAAGHRAYAITLPGLAMGDDPTGLRLADAVDHVVAEVERRDLRDVVLVGHSFAGIPITGAVPRLTGRLAAIAFFSAFVPLRGQSQADAMGPELNGYLRATIEKSPDGTVAVDFASFQAMLMQDEPEPLQRLVYDQLTPQPGGYMLDALGVDGVGASGLPVTYVLAEKDLALAAPGEELAARAGVEPLLVPGTHEALLTHPDEVARALLTGI
ncbi:alpha/beta fold hydrolase [Actinoplanes auranticolor]|uniref:Salicylate esterase n=1 Tax=Actinoplanes auranticolor TaxID=47988 RepID=A0A919VUG5_9ACTN|nr:alpha/beta hydrolase [Actinoplanes auranticolor]GIM69928.1 salicylate esterase [Actinoplanes auranticolor]